MPERELPADFKRGSSYEHVALWRPRWIQRLLIGIGFNVVVKVKVVSQHKPGNLAIGVFPEVSKYYAEELKGKV